MKDNIELIKNNIVKIIYFDENSAMDYLIIKNEGNLKKIYEKATNNETEKEFSFNGNLWAKIPIVIGMASAKTTGNFNYEKNESNVIQKTISNSLLSDFIKETETNTIFSEFVGYDITAVPNSFAFFKMFTPYLKILSNDYKIDENTSINISNMDNVFEDGKGYYELLGTKNNKMIVLRFNIKSFRNNYTLSDLTKMNLKYIGINVGKTNLKTLDIINELNPTETIATNISDLESDAKEETILNVYDVLLAGVINNEN